MSTILQVRFKNVIDYKFHKISESRQLLRVSLYEPVDEVDDDCLSCWNSLRDSDRPVPS